MWVNDRNFHELGNERDPIIGSQDGTLEFKVPKRPIRKTIKGLPAFTTVRGGAYFSCRASRRFVISQDWSVADVARLRSVATESRSKPCNFNHGMWMNGK